MNYLDLRTKYPKFIYESYSINGNEIRFNYSISDHHFVHKIVFENLAPITQNLEPLVFNLGIAEMFSYWKLTCSPTIELSANGYQLSAEQLAFWHKLFIRGMGQYFYENQINFTKPDFVVIKSDSASKMSADTPGNDLDMRAHFAADRVLVPIGGGKDSIVTYELLNKHFDVQPITVYPTTPASLRMFPKSIIVRRTLDPQILEPKFLKGHIPYSAILAFIYILTGYQYIAVSNERSSEEGNVEYLGHIVNHQYSKTLEFETDFNNYLKSLNLPISYFSFLRPIYELQITKLFSKMPQYFDTFRSCNKNQQQDSWCGHCPKCVSTALLLKPFLSKDQITKIIGRYPEESEMRELTVSKPFECILTKAEAQAALTGEGLEKILSSWLPNPNMPPQFEKILKDAYANS